MTYFENEIMSERAGQHKALLFRAIKVLRKAGIGLPGVLVPSLVTSAYSYRDSNKPAVKRSQKD